MMGSSGLESIEKLIEQVYGNMLGRVVGIYSQGQAFLLVIVVGSSFGMILGVLICF